MKYIKVVIFDLYGTLVRIPLFHNPYGDIFRASSKKEATRDEILRSHYGAPDKLVHSLTTKGLIQGTIDIELLNQKLESDLQSIEPQEHMAEVLLQLRERSYHIGVISDCSTPYAAAFSKLPEYTLVDHALFSCETGSLKSEEYMFRDMAHHFKCSAAEMLMVGDNKISDFEIPKKLGLQALLLKRGQPARQGEQIASLSEVLMYV